MSRRYVIFGSDDKVNWEILNTVDASSPEQAMGKGREQEAHNHYAAVPERNWSVGTPQVIERPPVVKWESVTPGQMTVDEVVEEPAVEERTYRRSSTRPPAEEPEEEKQPTREGVL